MSVRLSDRRYDSGQITVFLALLFFLILGMGLLVFDGMREYMKAAFVEEAFDQAGEDILADYDRSLFDRYHIFLMDPREEAYLPEDGKEAVSYNLSSGTFFAGVESDIKLDSTKKALDDDGKTVLTQIKKWETCQGVQKVPDLLKQLLDSTEKKESVMEALSDCEEEESSQSSSDEDEDRSDGKSSDATSSQEEKKKETEEERRVKSTWREWKQVLSSILDSGILLYVLDDTDQVSDLTLSSRSSLPSQSSWKNRLSFQLDDISLTGLSQLKKLCSEGVTVDKSSSLLTSDTYLIPYIFEHYSHYKNVDKEKTHRLKYEIEYLLGGKAKDKANLKYVADQLFLLRFIVNYGYAVNDAQIRLEAESMALILTGILGFPEGAEAVSMLLIASLCYGESLLEVRALFAGEKVALVKTQANWNLTFKNAAVKLKNHSDIIKVSKGVTYEEYLAGLLIIQSGSRRLLYRMMDIMQVNVTLDEPDFLMKNCITSYEWTGSFSWNPFYRRIIAFGINQSQPYTIKLSRSVGYQ